MTESNRGDPSPERRFADEARKQQPNVLREFAHFLAHNKKWWLLPILVVFAGVGFLVFLSGTAAAPFVYTLF